MDQTISYRFGRDDYSALVRARRSIGPLGRLGTRGRGLRLGLLLGLLGAGQWVVSRFDLLWVDPWHVLIVGTILFVFMLLLMILVAPVGERLGDWAAARWQFPQSSIANKDVTLEFGEEGIRSKVGGVEGRFSWPSFARVIETRDGLFLALSRTELLAVPRRALPSAEAFAGLVRQVRARLDASTAG
jgi:hypothetical protein